MTEDTLTEQENSADVGQVADVAEPAIAQAQNGVAEPRELTNFRVGDTVKVYYRITEGEKTRIQPYEGIVIGRKGEGMSKSFMVRKIGADGIGVERIFQLYSPNIEKLEVVKPGKVRRAKLFYLRDKLGRDAVRIKERKEVSKVKSK